MLQHVLQFLAVKVLKLYGLLLHHQGYLKNLGGPPCGVEVQQVGNLNDTIERVNSFKLLSLWINNTLKWNTHIEEFTKKASKRLFYVRECRRASLPTKVGLTCYETKLRPVLDMRPQYGVVWHNTLQTNWRASRLEI